MSFLQGIPQITAVRDLARQKKTTVFIVGGAVRDFLLERPCFDFDFAVSQNAVAFARRFSKKIKGAFVLLDEEHGCARVVKKSRGNLYTFDFADFRGDTLKKDLSHRDFTVNTLFCGVEGPAEIGDVKGGRRDLEERKIRMVTPKVFQEDPLRLLRAFSLKALLDFRIDPSTLAQIRKDRDLIRHVSYERIRDELFKILESERAGRVLADMDDIGLLNRVMPQIEVMYDVEQGTYHHLDVWHHSLETVVQLEKIFKEGYDADGRTAEYVRESFAGRRTRKGLMKLAALLHDIGKPDARKKEPGRISFHGHERVGRAIVHETAKMLKLSTRERHALEDMVLWHLRPGYLSNFKKPSDRAVFRYLRDTKEEAVSIALLSLADQRSTRGPLTTEKDQVHHENICNDLIRRYFIKKDEKPFVRLIDGNDLIRSCKLTPSPLFKKILDAVEERQVIGELKTKKEALALAKKIIDKEKK